MLRPDLGAVAVSRAMVLMESGVGFPVVECAVLPGRWAGVCYLARRAGGTPLALGIIRLQVSVLVCCACTGTGNGHYRIMGTSTPADGPELADQALKAIVCSQEICAGSCGAIAARGSNRRILHKLHETQGLDIYVMLREPRVPGVGLAIACTLLSVAFGQAIDSGILMAGVSNECGWVGSERRRVRMTLRCRQAP